MSVTRLGTDTVAFSSTATYPTATILSTDLLVLFAADISVGGLTTPGGWTLIGNTHAGGATIANLSLYVKVATGGESGTFTVTGATVVSVGVRRGVSFATIAGGVGGFAAATPVAVGISIATPAALAVPIGAFIESCAAWDTTGAGVGTQTMSGTNWAQDIASDNSKASGLTHGSNTVSPNGGTAPAATHSFTNGFTEAVGFVFWLLPICRSAITSSAATHGVAISQSNPVSSAASAWLAIPLATLASSAVMPTVSASTARIALTSQPFFIMASLGAIASSCASAWSVVNGTAAVASSVVLNAASISMATLAASTQAAWMSISLCVIAVRGFVGNGAYGWLVAGRAVMSSAATLAATAASQVAATGSASASWLGASQAAISCQVALSAIRMSVATLISRALTRFAPPRKAWTFLRTPADDDDIEALRAPVDDGDITALRTPADGDDIEALRAAVNSDDITTLRSAADDDDVEALRPSR